MRAGDYQHSRTLYIAQNANYYYHPMIDHPPLVDVPGMTSRATGRPQDWNETGGPWTTVSMSGGVVRESVET
jgi:hypothetical protein